jgi:hypothetical protein
MVPCCVERSQGITGGHVCPVPGCGRYQVDGTYLNADTMGLVFGPKPVGSTNSTLQKAPSVEATPARPLNRQTAARAAILRAIQERQPQ